MFRFVTCCSPLGALIYHTDPSNPYVPLPVVNGQDLLWPDERFDEANLVPVIVSSSLYTESKCQYVFTQDVFMFSESSSDGPFKLNSFSHYLMEVLSNAYFFVTSSLPSEGDGKGEKPIFVIHSMSG